MWLASMDCVPAAHCVLCNDHKDDENVYKDEERDDDVPGVVAGVGDEAGHGATDLASVQCVLQVLATTNNINGDRRRYTGSGCSTMPGTVPALSIVYGLPSHVISCHHQITKD